MTILKYHQLKSADVYFIFEFKNLIPRTLVDNRPNIAFNPVPNALWINATEIAISFGTPSFINNRIEVASLVPKPIGIIEIIPIVNEMEFIYNRHIGLRSSIPKIFKRVYNHNASIE